MRTPSHAQMVRYAEELWEQDPDAFEDADAAIDHAYDMWEEAQEEQAEWERDMQIERQMEPLR